MGPGASEGEVRPGGAPVELDRVRPAPVPPPVVERPPAHPAPTPAPSDASGAERSTTVSRVRSAFALLIVAALGGVVVAATVALGLGVIWLVLRRFVGG